MTVLRILFATLALCLIGCGPGVGGTGTGEVQDQPTNGNSSGAPVEQSASVCSAPFAGLLACTQTGVDAATTAGTQPVELADAPVDARVSATLAGQTLALRLPCQDRSFLGSWARTDSGQTRFVGRLTRSTDPTGQPATVAAEAQADALVVNLYDASGQLLAGPLSLQRVSEAPPAPASCL